MPIFLTIPVVLSAALLAGSAMAGSQRPGCQPQAARLPPSYARLFSEPPLAANERLHLRRLSSKGLGAGAEAGVDVSLQEIALSGSGTCDLVATVRDPLSSGGDSDVLTTLYLARSPSGWLRVGAVSARRDDRPASLDLVGHGDDAQFAFSDFRRQTLPSDAAIYLIAWHSERVANGFDGYRVFVLDRQRGRLSPLDRWEGRGQEVYAAFKAGGLAGGFDVRVEREEVRRLCASFGAASQPAAMAAACDQVGR